MSQAQIYAELFARSYPKAVDVLEAEYLKDKAEADSAAASAGYRLAGYRQGRAVFTSKTPRGGSA